MIEDLIINHYRKNGISKPFYNFDFLKDLGAINLNPGLGDSILLKYRDWETDRKSVV